MDIERLNHMARQIARNFAVLGSEDAEKATAKHIFEFWEPRMIIEFKINAPVEFEGLVSRIEAHQEHSKGEQLP